MEGDIADKAQSVHVERASKKARASPATKAKAATPDSGPASKRRCVSTACIACRRRKSKCDGNLPSCAACSSVYHTPCLYDPNSDHRRKGVYRKDVDTLRTRNSTLHTLIHAILNYDEEDALDLVRQIRSCDDLEDVAESIIAREKGLTLATDGVGSNSDENLPQADQFESELAGKMSELVLDGSRKFVGGTSNLIFLPPGSELYESNLASNDQGLEQRPEDSVTRWTRVTDDEQLISHLITMYFTWHYPFFTTLSKDLFYRDYVRGMSSQYCSSLLVNAMLALGCHFSSREGAREDPQNSSTSGDHFFKEAKRLLLENDEHENAKLCTVQALALMSVREAGCGREGKGWVYSGMSFRMAFDLGLNLDASSLGTHTLSEEEIDARRITFWGCFLFDKCWSNYLGRQPQLSTSNVSVPKPDILPKEEAELWSPYTDSGVGHDHSQPSRIRAVALQVSKLCEISGDLLGFFYHPTPMEKPLGRQTQLKKLSEIHTRLEAWKKILPREMDSKEGQLPQVLVMHMFYQLLLIHLYRPFLKYTKTNSPLPSHVSPRKLCTQAASSISKLLRMYKRTYGFKQICNIVVYMAHTACTVHLLNLPEKNAQRDIVHGLKNLEEMGESWLCARRTLRILDISANKWQVQLPNDAVTVLERTHMKWGSWGSWDQASSPSTSDESPTIIPAQVSTTATSRYSSPGTRLQHVQQYNDPQAPGVTTLVRTTTTPYPPASSSIPTSSSTLPAATRRSLNAQLQRPQIALPEPTYLRPVTQVSYPFQSIPVSQQDPWYNAPDGQYQRLNNKPNTPCTTETSPMTAFDGPENLVEESQDWWSREQNALAFGMDTWAQGWNAANPGTTYELSYPGNIASAGPMPGTESGSGLSALVLAAEALPNANASEPGTSPNIPGYNNVIFPGNFQ